MFVLLLPMLSWPLLALYSNQVNMQYEQSNNTCMTCLIQNEASIKNRIGISEMSINFYAFCVLGT